MSDSIDQYDVRFPRTQALLRQRLPFLYRLIGQLYLRVLSVDRYKLQRSLKQEVSEIRNTKNAPLVFVQVGSNDGLTNDPIRDSFMMTRVRQFLLSQFRIALLA